MENIKHNRQSYHQAIITIMESAKLDFPLLPEMQDLLLQDAKQGHYQLLRLGWNGKYRIFQVLMHLELRLDNKIWIQENLTAIVLEEELLKKGIPAEAIVLGLEYPAYRQFSGFALT